MTEQCRVGMCFCMNDYFKKIGSYTGKRVLDIFFHKVRSLLLSKLIFIILQYLIYYITVIDNKTSREYGGWL